MSCAPRYPAICPGGLRDGGGQGGHSDLSLCLVAVKRWRVFRIRQKQPMVHVDDLYIERYSIYILT